LDEMPTYTVVSGKLLSNDTIAKNAAKIDSLYLQMNARLDSVKNLGNEDSNTINSISTKLEELIQQKINISPFNSKIVALNGINSTYGEYKANPSTGKFTIILEPGVYEIKITHPLYQEIVKRVTIYDKKGFTPFLNMDFSIRE